MKRSIITLFFKIVNSLIRVPLFLGLFNFIYERLSFRWVNFVAFHLHRPEVNTVWTIVLPNGHEVRTRVDRANRKTWEFAVSYKSNDPALNLLENILDTHLDQQIPWIDVGANLGIRSLTALSTHRPVYFVEPNVELNAINKERCELNGFTNYEFLVCGASDVNGELTFYIDTSSYLSSLNAGVVDETKLLKKEVIPVRTVDSLFEKNIGKWEGACIKIDTEGHEDKVLVGAQRLIDALSPVLIIEINEKGAHIAGILRQMKNKGYKTYGIRYETDFKFLIDMDSILNPDETFLVFNFLFVRNEELVRVFDPYVYPNPY